MRKGFGFHGLQDFQIAKVNFKNMAFLTKFARVALHTETTMKQGRTHDSISHVQLGRGNNVGGSGIGGAIYMTTSVPCDWAGVLMQKPPK